MATLKKCSREFGVVSAPALHKNPPSFNLWALRGPLTRCRLGPAFGRTDFSRIFIFGPPDFFADFLAGFFLLIFVGKSAQKNPPPGKSPGKILQNPEKSSRKIPGKILQNLYNKNPPTHFGRLAVTRRRKRRVEFKLCSLHDDFGGLTVLAVLESTLPSLCAGPTKYSAKR